MPGLGRVDPDEADLPIVGHDHGVTIDDTSDDHVLAGWERVRRDGDLDRHRGDGSLFARVARSGPVS
jgi:hypothetical protein